MDEHLHWCSLTVYQLYLYLTCVCLLVATRETSFVHAISAAGVMYTLTRNCSLGDLDNCGCDNSRNGKIGKNS